MPDLEPLLQPSEEENEQGIPIEKEVMVTEKATSERHAQKLPIHASKKKEAMNDIVEHYEEQENVDERRDHIGWSSVLENPSEAYVEKPERVIVIPGVDSIRTSTMSAMKDSIRSSRITKTRQSQRKTTGTRATTEATNVPVPLTNTLSATTCTDLNEVWQLTLSIIKFCKNNIIQ